MKKIYFLVSLVISTLSFGQTTIFNLTTGGAYPSGWTDVNTITTNTIDKTTYYLLETSAAGTDIITSATYDLSSYTSATLNLDVATFGSGTNFPAKVEISFDGGATYTQTFTTATPTSTTYVVGTPVALSSVSNQVKIRFTNNGSGAVGKGVRIKNIKLDAIGTNPDINITAPVGGTLFSPETTNVNVDLAVVNFNVANGTGDGHIRYTINGGAGVMKYDTTPIAVPTTPGAYTVYVELVNNSNVAIAPAQNATVNFTVASYTTVADLATLRTQVLNGYYSLSSAPVTTHVRPVIATGMATRNQKYIQDATGAILIDDATGVLNVLAIAESESISGLKGQLTSFSSVLQFVPLTSVGVVNNPATPVVPAVLTFADITANPAGYRESELVNLGNVTFSNLIGTPFAVNTNYTIGQGADTTVFRTLFNQVGEVDYIGTTVPTTADVIAIVTRNGATKQVVVRKLADMTNLSRNSFDAISGLNIYPNPAKNFLNITSSSLEAKTVAIYNVLGAQVLTANVTNAPINIASLSKGVYVVKVTEEGKTATRKLVIQ
jgi:hypothetical protein